MRVLFQPFAAPTHVAAQVPLAWALRAAGHEVRVAAQPDVVDDITRAGLTAVPVGESLHVAAKMNPADTEQAEELRDGAWLRVLDPGEIGPERLTPEHLHGLFAAWTPLVHRNTVPDRMIDDLVAYARDWRPDLVVWDTMTYAGPVAARASGAAHARLMFGLDLVGLLRERYRAVLDRLPPELRDDPLEEWLGQVLGRHGLEGPGRGFDEELVVGQWTLDPVPTSLALPVSLPRVPVRYVPYNGPAGAPLRLDGPEGRRRICLTLGVSFREVVGEDQASVGELLEAVAGLDVEVVATLDAGQLAALGPLPPNVRAFDFVPLDELLPSCAAIIHHGGAGTFLTALAHGVPQVVVPARMWCNTPRAERARAAGVALTCPPERLTAARLRAMVTRVLDDPSFARAADRVRTEMLGTPTPADIVPVLERLVSAHRSRVPTGA
ncbi:MULTISPECIES: activator-dependent family glycosyltransferase [unclassified Streptomyces]|uniref:activator-dependent family glycosyltransferase n=1 Tax=unclassified Streptomyces TaxID=2593676 RepID=UPI0006F97CD7|nr:MULTISPECIES: activator-dependent family glycosyltransferase [unclassified Streptomyces]KQX56334.1 glycosyl transferase family 28 [Streptomyces sp. Root1304]KRA97148.1 glycosyl transferase family 28 [Streptomyces sp. Root66D1]